MEALQNGFLDGLAEAIGRAAGGMVVWGTLLVFVATFLFVLFVVTRRKWPGFSINVNLETPAGSSSRSAVAATTPAPKRELPRLYPAADAAGDGKRFLRRLDSADKVVSSIYLGLTVLLLVGATLAMGWVWYAYPDDGNRDFMLFYCGAVYFVAMLTLLAKLAGVRRRLADLQRPPQPGILEQLRSKVQVSVESSPEVFRVDAAALEQARRHLASGGTLDDACALADPRYRELPSWSKTMFRQAMKMALGDG